MFGRSDAPENIFQPKNLPAVRGYFDFVKSLSENGKKIFVSQCFIGISEETSPIFVDVHVFSRPQRGVRTFSDMTSAFHAP